MNTSGSEIKILAGNSSKELAQKIAEVLDFNWTMFYPSKKKKKHS